MKMLAFGVASTSLLSVAAFAELRCTESIANVTASAMNYDVATGAPMVPVSGTYGIQLRFCEPTAHVPSRADTVQVLVHGITYNMAYWDAAYKPEMYSYARFAAARGFATLNLARFGYEASEHPDPIGVVQYPLGAAVLVELLKLARGGGVPGAAGRAFGTLVYVGHSAGSILGNGILELAPDLVDAAVMSGVSHTLSDADFVPIFGFHPARDDDPTRFSSLPADYLTTGNVTNRESSFYSARGTFEHGALAYDEATKDTTTTGEAATTTVLQRVVLAYTGHVLAIAGDGDIFFCAQPGCANLDAEGAFYPSAASFESAVVANTGHSLNLHKSAPDFYRMVESWLVRRGF